MMKRTIPLLACLPQGLSSGACALMLIAATAGCGDAQQSVPVPQPVTVLAMQVQPEAVAVADELPGRVVAYRTAEIRPQVGGIIRQRLFEQGSMVEAGQPLFQIDPAPFVADARTATAALERAEATLARARVQVARLRPLVGEDAISRQSYDDALVARDQALADVAQARATAGRRRLDVGFARVTSPISGQIGQAMVTEGALVTAGDTSAMATVQQIDQVYVDVRQPAERLDVLRDAVAAGTADPQAPVEILSRSGKPYPVSGRMLFSGITVDPATGNAIVRVLVPNPARQLLPGMFVRARLARTNMPRAIAIPQQAVTRDPSGAAQVSVVNGQGRVKVRRIEVGEVVDGRYLVLSGLRAGETIIVEGQDRVQTDVPVEVKPWRGAPAPTPR